MSDYISRQNAVDTIKKNFKYLPGYMNATINYIKELPSADVAPVVHGRWIHMQNIYGVAYCSECSYELHAQNVNFCPNCGAKMDGEE